MHNRTGIYGSMSDISVKENILKNRNIIESRMAFELKIYMLFNVPLFFSNKLRRYLKSAFQFYWNYEVKDKASLDYLKHRVCS